MNASAYPTLDLLGQYGLRQAYLILMLGARSGTHLQHLHDEVIPVDCRLPRNLFIELKHERKRMLETGGEEENPIRQGPSDEELLREFNAACRSLRERKDPSLLSYYLRQLSDHCGQKDGMRRFVQNGNAGNYSLHCRLSDGDLDDLSSCKVNGVSLRAALTVHHHNVQADPPEGFTLPKDFTLSKVEKTLRLRLRIDHNDIHHLSTPQLLELPEWDGCNVDDCNITIYHEFPYPAAIPLPAPNENNVIVLDKATVTQLLAFLAERGIPLEVDLSTVA